jgi:thiol-disulfide isomerase/thioredoxin
VRRVRRQARQREGLVLGVGQESLAPEPSSRSARRVREIVASPRALALAVALATAFVVTAARGAESLKPWSGGPPPNLVLKTLDGREVSLASFRGRTVVVNFWATWCEPCVAEMPALQRMREKLAPEGVEVIAVNLKESAARIAPFVEQLGLTFPVVLDADGSASRAWRVNVFPTSFVIAPDQQIVWFVRGEVNWDGAQTYAQIRRANRDRAVPGVQRAAVTPTLTGSLALPTSMR